jgi:Sulfotransferase family
VTDHQGGPVLVTGMPRTATSWVGKMLEASGALVYVNEPLNPQHPPGRSPGVLRADVEHAFQYISEENERVWLPAFRDTVRLRFHPLAEVRRNHRPYDLLRAVKYTAGFGLGRLRGRRALLDDPYAVFAAPWLHRRVGCRVVVTVRDPVATVSSWRRLGWTPRLAELLAQPALVRDRLGRFAPELEAALAAGGDGRGDGVGQASLLWRVIYGTVAAYRREIDGLEVVRHEDLSADPVPAFRALYGRLGLPFGPGAERAVLAATSAGSGGADATGIRRLWAARPRPRPEGPRSGAMRWSLSGGGVSKTAARRLDSRANLQVWRERLTPEEVARIRDLTADVAGSFGYT